MRQHRVRFALEKDYQVYDVVHQYYTEEEHASLWWSREEYRETKKEAQAIVDALESNGRIVVCTRGLEQKTRDGSIQKRLAALDSICAVLMEQERQFQQGISGVELIRTAYLMITAKTTVEARERGAEDALCDETEDEFEYNPATQDNLSWKKERPSSRRQRFFQVITRRRDTSSKPKSRIGRSLL
jgi:hypothetical protein